MRIKFETWILFCDFVAHPGKHAKIINAGTDNGLYTIFFDTADEAAEVYDQLLKLGYYDASENGYSNIVNPAEILRFRRMDSEI